MSIFDINLWMPNMLINFVQVYIIKIYRKLVQKLYLKYHSSVILSCVSIARTIWTESRIKRIIGGGMGK